MHKQLFNSTNIAGIDFRNRIIRFISLSRPLIREPGLMANLLNAKQTASQCNSCSYCAFAYEIEPLRCSYGKLHNNRVITEYLGTLPIVFLYKFLGQVKFRY